MPSDLGAWLAVTALRERHGQGCVDVKAAFTVRGGFNGGTLASALNMLDSGQANAMADPFLLNPPGQRPREPIVHADPVAPHRDAELGGWLGPFFMGPVNTRVVRRSAALLGYGPDFHYQEYLRLGRGAVAALSAASLSFGMEASQAALRLSPVRRLARAVAPAPGQGPSEQSMNRGSFRCELVGTGDAGAKVRVRVADQGDPGNRATTKMVCTAALTLLQDPEALSGGLQGGGVLTPASGLGQVFVERLRAAGMMLEVTG